MTTQASFARIERARFVIPSWVFSLAWIGIVAFVCLVIAFFMAAGAWLFCGIILGAMAAAIMLMVGFEKLAIFWVIGIPSVFTYVNNVASVIPAFTVDRMLFLVIYFILIVRVLMRKRKGLKLDWFEKLAVALLVIMFASMIYRWAVVNMEEFRADGALLLTGYAMPLGAYGIARRIQWTEKLINRVLLGLCLNGAFLGMVSIAQYPFGITLFNATYMEGIYDGEQMARALGTFAGPWEHGAVTAALSVIGLYVYCKQDDPVRKLAVLMLFGFTVIGLILGLTRAPWLAFLIGATVLAMTYRRVRPLYGVFVFLGVFAVVLAFPYIAAAGYLDGRILEMSPIFNRIALWATSCNIALHNPLIGVGFGAESFPETAPDYLKGFGPVQAHWVIGVAVPHNEILNIAVMSGIPAAILFVTLVVRLLTTQMRTINDRSLSSSARTIAALALALLVVYIINMMMVDLGFGRYIGVLVFFVCGIAASVRVSGSPKAAT